MADKIYESVREFENDFIGFELTKVTNDPQKGQKLVFSIDTLSEGHTVTASVDILHNGRHMGTGNFGLYSKPNKSKSAEDDDKPKGPPTNLKSVTINEAGVYNVSVRLYAYEGKTHRGKDHVWKSSKMIVPVEFKEEEITKGAIQQAKADNAVNKFKKKQIEPKGRFDKGGGNEWER